MIWFWSPSVNFNHVLSGDGKKFDSVEIHCKVRESLVNNHCFYLEYEVARWLPRGIPEGGLGSSPDKTIYSHSTYLHPGLNVDGRNADDEVSRGVGFM